MKAVSKPGARVSRPLHVLIVDDSKADAELLLRTLLAGGFEASHQLVDTQAAMRTAIGAQRLGQPVPDSNFVSELNSALLQQTQR